MTERIGRYEILATIGAGGMSTVYRARLSGPALAAKEVALKVIHPHLGLDRDFVLMFLDEMRLAMALAHRNIVQTFDAGKEEETYFLVMELVNGLSLRDLLDILGRSERMPLDLVLFVAAEVAAALEYAHNFESGGVVHRDVSPGNILLSSQGDVKLTDFGVAKVAGGLARTSSNMVMGKLSYMAPEQALGRGDLRSDIFALGAVLFEMLCGEPIRLAQDLREVMSSRPDPGRLRQARGMTDSLIELVMSCLDPLPDRRPATAGELQRRLGDEIFRLPRNPRLASDAHARLQSYMAVTLAQHPQQVQASEKTSALAKILLEEVRALATRPSPPARAPAAAPSDEQEVPQRRSSEASVSLDPSLPAPAVPRRGPRTRRQPDKATAVGLRRWRRALPWAGAALGILVGVALSWAFMRRDAPPVAARNAASSGSPTRPQPVDRTAPAPRTTLATTANATETRPHRRVAPSRAHVRVAPSTARTHGGGSRAPAAAHGGKLVLRSQPAGAEVFEGSRRLGKTPLPLTTAKPRTLGVYAHGYEPQEVKIAAGASHDVALQLRRSVLARDTTSLRQLRALRQSGQISEFSYRRRKAELVSQKLVELKVQRKTGLISEEQYQRLVESVKAGNE